MKRIIAFDPGEQTGWAHGILHEPGDCGPDASLSVLKSGYDPWKTVALRFYERMMTDPYDVVVYEAWRLRRSSALQLVGSDMQSSQCIGCIKLACWVAGRAGSPVEIVHNEPAEKSVIDAAMGGTGYLPTSGVEHDRDALRHLWHYAIFKGGVRP